MPEEQKFHYYATTAFTWIADDDLWKALSYLKRQGGRDGTAKKGTVYTVFRVPGTNADTNYEIRGYAPQVEGAELIAVGEF